MEKTDARTSVQTDHFRFPSYLDKWIRFKRHLFKHLSFFLGGMILLRAHIPLNFRKVSGVLRNIKNCSKSAWFIFFVEFPYICNLWCLDDFQRKLTQNRFYCSSLYSLKKPENFLKFKGICALRRIIPPRKKERKMPEQMPFEYHIHLSRYDGNLKWSVCTDVRASVFSTKFDIFSSLKNRVT